MGSYSQRFPYRCQNGHEGSLAVWLVVDGEEQPDLLRRAGEGELTPPRCLRQQAPRDPPRALS